jgi:murein DD-endopeptidase MepM/ murein hydrolase activator NlpD
MSDTEGGESMGNYNNQYEDYYKSLRKNFNTGYTSSQRKRSNGIGEYLLKRLPRDLIGALSLIFVIMLCKLVVTPQTQTVYNYSKSVVNKSYDYKSVFVQVKNLNVVKVEDKVTDWMETLKSKVSGEKTLKDKIKEEFIIPVQGQITSPYGYRIDPIDKKRSFHEGIDIDAKEGTEVKCPYDGKVKDCGQDNELGNYIVIDHGDGIETKYGHLKEIKVKKGDATKKSSVIGLSGNTGKSTAPHLHFEILYMGENKDPKEFIAI